MSFPPSGLCCLQWQWHWSPSDSKSQHTAEPWTPTYRTAAAPSTRCGRQQHYRSCRWAGGGI